MSLNDGQKELIRLSEKYNLKYATFYVNSKLRKGSQKHIFVWIPYTVCDKILPLLIADDESQHFNGDLFHDCVVIDLNDVCCTDFDDDSYQFIQLLSGIKLEMEDNWQ